MKVTHPASDFDGRIISSSSFLAYRSALARPFSDPPYEGCNALSAVTSDLRRSDSRTSLQIFGYLVDRHGNPFPKTGIEVWHLTPRTNQYNSRAYFNTNSRGYYEFITNLPERARGKNYEVYFRIKKDNISYYTKLIFNYAAAILSSNIILKNHQAGQREKHRFSPKSENNVAFQFDIELCADS